MTDLICSYRLQLNKDFTLHDAAQIVPYLRRLGVSHLYLSPIMQCRAGSDHGYDVTDMTNLSAERGGRDGLDALSEALGDDVKLIIDIVPNHMAASAQNAQWRDVLKHGKQSDYWPVFDIFPAADGKITLPVLADDADVLWSIGALYLQKKNGEWVLRYQDMDFPLSPDTPSADDYADIAPLQHYRLEKWTDDAYSYRRFFHLKELVGLRVEDTSVMRQVHQMLFDLLDDYGAITGLRIDHIDGLADPRRYLEAIGQRGKHIWVEKILARGEALPDWPVTGTTGYEFIDALNNLLINPAGFEQMDTWWRTAVDPTWPDFDTCLHAAKKEVIVELFPTALRRLSEKLAGNAEQDEAYAFLFELTAALPAYRVYGQSRQDIDVLSAAVAAAEAQGGEAFKGLRQKFLPRLLSKEQNSIYTAWQQLSGGVMAKGLEDCAHYRYTPLAALNEVGCVPRISKNGRRRFADFVNNRQLTQPCGMNASSTHDTKRSEDVRARLYALADMPQQWQAFYKQCGDLATAYDIPPATFHFFLQAAAGSWPLSSELPPDYTARLQNYMEKSAREEARHARHTEVSSAYIQTLRMFVGDILRHPDFLAAMNAFMARLAPCGALNALSALTLKCLSPGMPDVYQGCDVWDFSLVDPDNRRAVDYQERQKLLDFITQASDTAHFQTQLCGDWKNGAVKLWLLQRLLNIRKQYLSGVETYVEMLEASGAYADNLHAFLLHAGDSELLIAHPLYPAALGPLRGGICLPEDFCRNIALNLPVRFAGKAAQDLLSDIPVQAEDIGAALQRFPVAIFRFEAEAEPSPAG